MKKLDEVLHKPTPPPNFERWHIHLKGHAEELIDALIVIIGHDQDVIKTAEWLDEDELLICLRWIDEVMPRFVAADVLNVSAHITIIYNGRGPCHGHNMP